jgi:Tfp pilus assembly protein PilE
MFGRIKADAWLEGYNKGIDEAEELREIQQQSDANGITYASHGDYMKAKVAFNAKDTEIASLKEGLKDAKKVQASLAECHKELERFYLKAIGDCRTVKQVNAVVKRYHESESFKAWVSGVMKETFMVTLSTSSQSKQKGSQIEDAAATKIKRINKRDAKEVCDLLDTQMDRNCYASMMASTLKEVAGVEVDRTKILEAKQTGLNAWNVLLSLLSANGIKHDDVLGVR